MEIGTRRVGRYKASIRLLSVLAFLSSGRVTMAQDASTADLLKSGTGDWCYAPVGPLTTSLKEDFVAFAVDRARLAEKQYGVPGAVLAAMAIHESGYGRTRLALLANNVLSFKYPMNKAWQFDRPKFTLWCQPAMDVGNVYPLFGSMSAAFDYVAKTLSERTDLPYATITQQYRAALAGGQDKKAATVDWLKKVAGVYTVGSGYVPAVLSYADDPLHVGAAANPTQSLWQQLP